MGVGFGHFAPFAAGFGGDRRQLFLAAGEDVSVTLLQIGTLSIGQALLFAFGHLQAGFLQQTLDVSSPRVTVGLVDEGQLTQQMRAA